MRPRRELNVLCSALLAERQRRSPRREVQVSFLKISLSETSKNVFFRRTACYARLRDRVASMLTREANQSSVAVPESVLLRVSISGGGIHVKSSSDIFNQFRVDPMCMWVPCPPVRKLAPTRCSPVQILRHVRVRSLRFHSFADAEKTMREKAWNEVLMRHLFFLKRHCGAVKVRRLFMLCRTLIVGIVYSGARKTQCWTGPFTQECRFRCKNIQAKTDQAVNQTLSGRNLARCLEFL